MTIGDVSFLSLWIQLGTKKKRHQLGKRRENRVKNKKIISIILLLILIVFVFWFFKDNLLKIIYPKTYQEVISIYGEKYNMEENLIFAVIKAESNFNKEAISNRNAIGLMQLMEETAKDVAKKNGIEINVNNMKEELSDVYKNIEIGTCYIATLMQRYQNKKVALAAYNAGIGTVDG